MIIWFEIANQNNNSLTTMIIDDPKGDYIQNCGGHQHTDDSPIWSIDARVQGPGKQYQAPKRRI